jgi:Methyltransferase domain
MLSYSGTSSCPICNGPNRAAYQVKLLGKHASTMWTCSGCDFSHLYPVFWLDEAYAEAINISDVGYVDRNHRACDLVSALLANNCEPSDLFLDFGAGYGMFVRLMRDRGFRFQHYDPSCKNLFARFNEAQLEVTTKADDARRYKLATAIEVIEHTVDPVETVQRILQSSDSVLLSTEISASAPPDPGWWYLGLEHGQHISFFGARTFDALAASLSIRYTRLYPNWHLLSKEGLKLDEQKPSRFVRAIRWFSGTRKLERGLMMPDFDTTRLFLENSVLAAEFHNSIDEYQLRREPIS